MADGTTVAGVCEFAGSRIHYWLSGPEGGRPVVLTHGASMDHQMFDPQLPALHEAGYRTLTWDIRGHGQSKPIGNAPIHLFDLASELVSILDHLAITTPVCLVGQSLGGFITQRVVYAYPQRVSAVVLIGASSLTAPIPRWQRWTLAASPWIFKVLPQQFRQTVIANATAVDPDVRAYALSAAARLSRAEFVAIWKAVASTVPPDPDYRFAIPALLTHGSEDRTGNVARTVPGWAEREPHARYEVIPAAGHNANQDNPGAFNRVLLDFLADHYPAGDSPSRTELRP